MAAASHSRSSDEIHWTLGARRTRSEGVARAARLATPRLARGGHSCLLWVVSCAKSGRLTTAWSSPHARAPCDALCARMSRAATEAGETCHLFSKVALYFESLHAAPTSRQLGGDRLRPSDRLGLGVQLAREGALAGVEEPYGEGLHTRQSFACYVSSNGHLALLQPRTKTRGLSPGSK